MKKIFALLMALTLLCAALTSCGADAAIDLSKSYTKAHETVDYETNYVQIEIKGGAYIVVELYPDVAPVTVANFKKLVSEHFYDGIIFHRVISGFMIQGGDPTGTGRGGSEQTIKGEFSSNGFANTLAHTRGVISMARTNDPNSASSQFFIMHQTASHLDGNYAAFGKVLYGIETVDAIAAVKTDANDKPLTDVVMKSVRFIEKP